MIHFAVLVTFFRVQKSSGSFDISVWVSSYFSLSRNTKPISMTQLWLPWHMCVRKREQCQPTHYALRKRSVCSVVETGG